MRFIANSVLVLTVALRVLASPMLSQESTSPSGSHAVGLPAYPDTADGLQRLLENVLAAARSGHSEKVAAFVKEMEIPNYEASIRKNFPGLGEEEISPVRATLDKSERSMQDLFMRLAQNEGVIFARKVNDYPDPGGGLEWGMVKSLKKPVNIYFANWKKWDDATNSGGEPIGYFMLLDGGFRWDSRTRVPRMVRMTPVANRPVLAGNISPKQLRAGVPLVEQGVSNGLVLSRVQPSYPAEAKDKGVQGSVNMLAIISKTGEVTSLKLLDGDALLAPAAMDAVKQWKYRSYVLNGSPVEIQTVVTVSFALAGKN